MEGKRDGFVPLTERPRPSILAALALTLLALAGLWGWSLIMSALPRNIGPLWANLLYYVPFVLIPVAVYGLRRGDLSEGLRLNPMPLMPTLMIALLATMCVYAASAVNSLWALGLNALGLSEPQTSPEALTSGSLVLSVLHTAAIPAVCEELLFRGVVFSAFERRGTALGIWVSSMLFGLIHGSVYGLPAYVLVGAVSGFIVFATDSLYAGMFFHTVYNAAILVLLHMIESAAVASDAALTGGMIAGMVMDLVMVGLGISLSLTALNLRRRAAGIEAVPRAPGRLTIRERALLIVVLVAMLAALVAVQCLSMEVL